MAWVNIVIPRDLYDRLLAIEATRAVQEGRRPHSGRQVVRDTLALALTSNRVDADRDPR